MAYVTATLGNPSGVKTKTSGEPTIWGLIQ